MIEAENITKRYGGVRVLDGVSFAAGAGEAVALLGLNGAGKTTLLKCLLGLLRFEGVARLGGMDVAHLGKEARRLAGYLPQAPQFPPHLTAGDALEYYADLRGLRGEDIDARLEEVGLTAHADKRVAALSGGLRQRLGLAVALLGAPAVLLMDEPAANLDPTGRAIFADLTVGLRARGRTLLLSTHVFDSLDQMAERALVLVDGRMAYDGTMDELKAIGGDRPSPPTPLPCGARGDTGNGRRPTFPSPWQGEGPGVRVDGDAVHEERQGVRADGDAVHEERQGARVDDVSLHEALRALAPSGPASVEARTIAAALEALQEKVPA